MKANLIRTGFPSALLAVIGLAHQTNGLVTAMQVEVDDIFKAGA